MTDHCDGFEELYEEVKHCRKCREGCSEIRNLPDEDFMHRWHPYSSGDPPFAYIFFGWEPSSTGERPGVAYPECPPFSEPLQFAIRKFLDFPSGCKNFFVTNMAKCSIKGSLCAKTREFRFATCKWVLCRELKLARTDLFFPEFVSIGLDPRDFIHRIVREDPNAYCGIFGGRTIHRITHYARRNVNRLFKAFARGRAAEYERFCAQWQKEYADFVEKKYPWHLREDGRIPDGDLQTLFYWFTKDIPAIREGSSGKSQ